MKTKQEKIDIIYKEISNKELSLGCKIEVNFWAFCEWKNEDRILWQYVFQKVFWSWLGYIYFKDNVIPYTEEQKTHWVLETYSCMYEDRKIEDYENDWLNLKIIWHPVLLWTILNYHHSLDMNELVNPCSQKDIIDNWGKYDEPIEKQSEETIDYIFNLINKWLKKNM